MNKEERKKYNKEYKAEHKKEINQKKREYSQKNKKEELENPINKEKIKFSDKKYNKSKKGKNRDKRYAKLNPKKRKAIGMANYHLKHLKKPGFEFHHPNYDEPLNVRLLPIKVHQALHTIKQIKQRLEQKQQSSSVNEG